MELGSSFGKMEVRMMGNLLIMKYKGMGHMFGLIYVLTQGSGKETKCMDMGFISGLMEGNLKDSIKTI